MFEQPAPSPPPPLPPPVNVLDEPVVHMEIELARIQQGMLSPVIVISNINNVPEVQATVEISTDQGNEEEEDDTVRACLFQRAMAFRLSPLSSFFPPAVSLMIDGMHRRLSMALPPRMVPQVDVKIKLCCLRDSAEPPGWRPSKGSDRD